MVKLEDAIQSTKFGSEVQKAALNVLYSAWWLKTATSRELKDFGLTHEQFNVLRILKGRHPQQACVRDIAGRMIERSSNVPRIIDRLEIKKLVKRSVSVEDRRETSIAITNAGLNLLEMAGKKVDKIMLTTLSLTTAEATELNRLLEKMRENEV